MHKYGHVPSILNAWINYGESRLYGNGETVLIMKKKPEAIIRKSVDHENEVKVM